MSKLANNSASNSQVINNLLRGKNIFSLNSIIYIFQSTCM